MARKNIYDVLFDARPARAERKATVDNALMHSIPPHVNARNLVGNLLCMGANSPCEKCEVKCRYGRDWIRLKASGNVPAKYLKNGGSNMPEKEKKTRTVDEMADILRMKARARGDDALTDAAEMLEDLNDRVELLRRKLRMADENRQHEQEANRRQLQEDLALLSAYTGYQLVPGEYFWAVQKKYSEAVGRPVMTHEMADEELHETVKKNMRLELGLMITRAYGKAAGNEGGKA